PPPPAIQPISACPGLFWQLPGGRAELVVRGWSAEAVGSVQRYVPPTAVTSGSLAGQITVGYGIVTGFGTGSFLTFAVPESPVLARTVTPAADAALKASRRFSSDCADPKDSSA